MSLSLRSKYKQEIGTDRLRHAGQGSETRKKVYLGIVQTEGLVVNPDSIVFQRTIDWELTNTLFNSSLDDFPSAGHVSDLQVRIPCGQIERSIDHPILCHWTGS